MFVSGLMGMALVITLPACDSNGGPGDEPPGDGLEAPAAPSGLEAASQDGAAELQWDDVDGAASFTLYRDTESGVDASRSPLETGISGTSFTDETAENGTPFFYVVTAVAKEGGETAESDPSGEAEAIPFAPPTALEGTSGDAQVELSWEGGVGAEAFNVYRDTTSGVDASGEPLEAGIVETSFVDETAENGTTYFYVATSLNPKEEESGVSNEVEKTPFSDPPDRP